MRILRTANYALGVAAAAAILAGCSSSGSQLAPAVGGGQTLGASHVARGGAITLVPTQIRPLGALPLRGIAAPDAGKAGIYASEFYGTDILGYLGTNPKNKPATCTVSPVASPNGIAVDGQGDLIDPDGGTGQILIFKGPGMCGKLAASITDPYGQPADASSANALTGKILVGNIFDTGGSTSPGSVSICTVANGCTKNLTNPAMNEVAGVAMKGSNCWADATNSAGTATLTYFKKCAGKGVQTTGFVNTSFGGLDIDANGNIVSIDLAASAVNVYKGCTPACTKLAGPLALHGETVFGHLNKAGTLFAGADVANGEIDIYKYTGTSLVYKFSFNNGLSSTEDVEGVAFNPRSQQ
jgi:hypothetical protein